MMVTAIYNPSDSNNLPHQSLALNGFSLNVQAQRRFPLAMSLLPWCAERFLFKPRSGASGATLACEIPYQSWHLNTK